jgi:hypothetical protein
MNKLEMLKEPLHFLGSQIYKASGIKLDFTYCKRRRDRFNPEEPSEMIDIYPAFLFYIGNNSRREIGHDYESAYKTYEAIIQDTNIPLDYPKVNMEIKVETRDENDELEEDLDLAEALAKDLSAVRTLHGIDRLIIVIDELYLDTVNDKIKAETIEQRLLNEKIMQEFTPLIIKYLNDFGKLAARIGQILRANRLMTPFIELVRAHDGRMSETTNDYSAIERWREKGEYGNRAHALRLALCNLVIYETINDAIKGNTKNIKAMDTTLAYIVRNILNTHMTTKFMNIEVVLKSILGKGQVGSPFDFILARIMKACNNGFMETPENFRSMEYAFEGTVERNFNYGEVQPKDMTKILASKELLKYAESCDILEALQAKIDKKEIRMYAESITFTEDEIEAEMMKVTNMAREASIVKIDMEYITTKYSKKDAINNAYIVLQECQALRRKLKTKEAQDAIKIVINTLQKDIEETRKFDHKKSRMTINIAYPSGYEG